MASENPKSINRRWIQAFNEHDWQTEAACRTADYLGHLSGMPVPLDTKTWDGFMQAITAAFPDARITVEDDISEGDIVASRWTMTGTHLGEFQGVPASGKSIKVSGVDFSRVADGRITEHWAQFDLMALLQQIGAIPAP
jgi:steroid delta-isomerase-like uncharacterized protein